MKKIIFTLSILTFSVANSQHLFTSKGDVGIGTIDPDADLEVKGSGTIGGYWNPNAGFFKINNGGTQSIIMDSNELYANSSLIIGSKEDIYFRKITDVKSQEEDNMIIKSNGKVIIGSSDGPEKLSIKDGSIAIGDFTNDNWSKYTHLKSDDYGYNFQHNNATAITNEHGAVNQAIVLGDVSKNNNAPLFGVSLLDGGAWLPRFTVTGKGHVGIGTTDPQNELSVKGIIWAEEVTISLKDAADWVFNDDYNLMPLASVEQYIKNNKHLPEIPSAEEFRKEDLKVSEMTNKLLQKIEELTLYTIEQEKKLQKMETLEARLATLEKMLNNKN